MMMHYYKRFSKDRKRIIKRVRREQAREDGWKKKDKEYELIL